MASPNLLVTVVIARINNGKAEVLSFYTIYQKCLLQLPLCLVAEWLREYHSLINLIVLK